MIKSGAARSIGVLAGVLLMLACASQWNGQVVEEEGGLLRDAAVKSDIAIQKARAAVPGAAIQSAAIERENGALIYTFDMQIAGEEGIREVHVDATTGEVLSNEHQDEATEERAEADEHEGENEVGEAVEESGEEDEAAGAVGRWNGTVEEAEAGLLARAEVSAEDAVKAALAAVPGGEIAAAEIENEDGKFIYSFDVRVAAKEGIDEVWVDAITGAVISVKHEQ